ncbi:MAG: sulfatase-like hydrolase/transferase, partial [Spirochaetia bacterium]|nr:sulfatase-like hydrolase/transferase [Spirochaetia bacterium]
LLSGKNPGRLHLTTFLPGRPDAASQAVLHPEIMMHLPLSEKLMPRYFSEQGYATALIGKWHVGGAGFGPLEHGFDEYDPGQANTIPGETEGGKGEYDLTFKSLDFIARNKRKPFLLYLGHNTPHIPYTAKPHLIEKNKNAFEPVYAALIETLDDTVGIILQRLRELDLENETILIFTSDNGGLHVPELAHQRVTHNTPFRAGKGYVYEGGQRVPLIVRWPGKIPAGRVVEDPVINTDWLPTLLGLIGAPVPDHFDGMNTAPGMLGGAFPERPFFWHFPHYTNQGGRPSGAMREGKWLLVEHYDEACDELFDLDADIGERLDVSKQYPEQVERMKKALETYRLENNVQFNTSNPDFDEVLFEQLYRDFDGSMFDPLHAEAKTWEVAQKWRSLMDAVVSAKSSAKAGH